jgi:hypothetical protein
VTILDNWAQLPFIKHWKLYVTSIPYEIKVTGGESITSDFGEGSVGLATKQLKTVKPASLRITGSRLKTMHRNSVLVLVSIARTAKEKTFWRSLFQVFSKTASVTVFVFGTCVLSAVTLLAMPMAQLALMLILAAGIGSRAISGGIVNAVTKNEPMIHVITENEKEAYEVIREVFYHQQRLETNFQVEIKGHVFVDGRRVAKRSLWYRRILGVMASPFDLRKVKEDGWDEGYMS